MEKEITKSILQEANDIIYGNREKTYGDPAKNLKNIAIYWNTHLSARFKAHFKLNESDVCEMMILLKLARLINDQTHRDNLVDICGYAALQERVMIFKNEITGNSGNIPVGASNSSYIKQQEEAQVAARNKELDKDNLPLPRVVY